MRARANRAFIHSADLDLSLRDVEDGREVVAGVHEVLPLGEDVDLPRQKTRQDRHKKDETRTATESTEVRKYTYIHGTRFGAVRAPPPLH